MMVFNKNDNLSRRAFLSSTAAIGAAAALSARGLVAQVAGRAPLAARRRIDAHAHFTSPKLIEVVGRQELGNFANWTP